MVFLPYYQGCLTHHFVQFWQHDQNFAKFVNYALSKTHQAKKNAIFAVVFSHDAGSLL
jgi:hypothetical protein